MRLAKWNPNSSIEWVFDKVSSEQNVEELRSEILAFIYSVSLVSEDKILCMCCEANELFASLYVDNLTKEHTKRTSHDSLSINCSKVSAEQEDIRISLAVEELSFEYSSSLPSQKVEGRSGANSNTGSFICRLSEPKSRKISELDSFQFSSYGSEPVTPIVSPKFFRNDFQKLKVMGLIEEVNLELLRSEMMESDRPAMRTNCTDCTTKGDEKKHTCYKCEICRII
jgi:hypothetical protein